MKSGLRLLAATFLSAATGSIACAQSTGGEINQILRSPAPNNGVLVSSPPTSVDIPRTDPTASVSVHVRPDGPAEAEISTIVDALSPRSPPPPIVLSLAATSFIAKLAEEVSKEVQVKTAPLQSGDVIPPAVAISPIPPRAGATWPLASQFGLVVTQSQIAVVERSSRRITVLVNRATRVAVGPQQRFLFVYNPRTLRTIILDLEASIDQNVYFTHNSSTLNADARKQLLALGTALQSPALRNARFLISGHTNSVGSQLANRELAFRRAVAVRDHLSRTFGVAANRIEIYGFGFDRLKFPHAPQHPGNRRVEIALIVGGQL